MVVYQNFTGCIENLYFNSTNFIGHMKWAFEEGEYYQFEKHNIMYSCPEPPIIPVTFLTRESFAKLKGYEGVKQMNISFMFRTYEERGLMMYHEFTSMGYVKIYLEDGKVKLRLKTPEFAEIILDNYSEQFNDGRWHQLVLTMAKNLLVFDIDQRPMRTVRQLSFFTGAFYWIGGGKEREGFIGCMRQISVDGNYRLPTDWREEDYCCKHQVNN